MINLLSEYEFIILAGGFGTRLKPIVADLPKPMAPINGTPFLEILIHNLSTQGALNFRLLTGHLANRIVQHFDKTHFNYLNINYSHETKPLGTGGAIVNGINESEFKKFVVLNGDTYFNIDLNKFVTDANKNLKENKYTMALKLKENNCRYGSVDVDDNFNVLRFKEKSSDSNAGFINGGIYCFDNNLSKENLPLSFSIENDYFPTLASIGKLKGVLCEGDFIDIGIPDDYYLAQKIVKKVGE